MTSFAVYVFKEHRLAFVFLASLFVVELALAIHIGRTALGMSPGDIFKLTDVSLILAGWFLLPLLWLCLVVFALMRRRAPRPTRSLLRLMRYQRPWLIRGLVIALLQFPLARGFATLKSAIPHNNPFSWDPIFASIDRSIFSVDPWVITHSLLGVGGTIAIDRIYVLWGTFLLLLTGWISFTRNRHLQITLAILINFCWYGLGVVFATAFSSVGPIFYEYYYGDPRFSVLVSNLNTISSESRLFAMTAMKYLLTYNGTSRIGAGISAMPSLHVAIAYIPVLLCFAQRAGMMLKAASIAFLIIIWIGSVHLAWHYAVDGLASIVLTTVLWAFAAWVVKALRRPC